MTIFAENNTSHLFAICSANILKLADEEMPVSLLQVLTLISEDSYHEEMSLGPKAHCDSHYLFH